MVIPNVIILRWMVLDNSYTHVHAFVSFNWQFGDQWKTDGTESQDWEATGQLWRPSGDLDEGGQTAQWDGLCCSRQNPTRLQHSPEVLQTWSCSQTGKIPTFWVREGDFYLLKWQYQ